MFRRVKSGDSRDVVSELAVMDCHRLTKRFARDAIKRWDCVGQGAFDCFVCRYVSVAWIELVTRN